MTDRFYKITGSVPVNVISLAFCVAVISFCIYTVITQDTMSVSRFPFMWPRVIPFPTIVVAGHNLFAITMKVT